MINVITRIRDAIGVRENYISGKKSYIKVIIHSQQMNGLLVSHYPPQTWILNANVEYCGEYL